MNLYKSWLIEDLQVIEDLQKTYNNGGHIYIKSDAILLNIDC